QNRNLENEEKYEIVPESEFHGWKQLDHYISVHAKQNGFVTIIVGLESDAITRRRCRYVCEHQGRGNSKKTAILEQQKQSHMKQVKEDIEYYTSKGLNMRMQLSLLEDKYPNTLFLPQALSLTIQTFKQHSKVVNEASTFLEILLNKKAQDQNWPTGIMTLAKLLPEVDKWLAKFLTPPVLSMQRAEIAEALWYNLTLISRENIDKTLIQVQSECNFFEDLDDFPVTNIDEIVDSITLLIKEIWEVIHYRAAYKNYIVVFED
ncbi:6991_t:CDS:2, partial [Gigaspora rosea]